MIDALRGDTAETGPVALAAERRRVSDFVSLTKPRVVLMVVVTALVGYYLGAIGELDSLGLLHTLLGMAMAAGGTLALNQFLERDLDARMHRTRNRSLPGGRLQPREALIFAGLTTATGLVYLLVAVGVGVALVTAATSALYLGVYTPLKRVTALSMVIGAVPGALPPVAGWVAARGDIGVEAGVLFAILFLWQQPHTLAIAWLYREDYIRGGVRVLPVADPEGATTARQIVAGCLALQVVSVVPTLIGLAGSLYFFGALALGAGFLACGVALALAPSGPAARRVILASVAYLPLLLALMALDKVGS
jgi:protoheme IX farnesyltransferase